VRWDENIENIMMKIIYAVRLSLRESSVDKNEQKHK
jgi:hypothetical protein